MKRLVLNDQDHRRGDPKAKVTLVEFGDFQCPYCANAFPIVESTLEELGARVQFAFRNFPLTTAHPFALAAAMTAEAAGRQGKYWEMHRLLYEHQKLFQARTPLAFAERAGLSLEVFERDFQSADVKEKIEADFNSGIQVGVNGTPAFYINGEPFSGDWTKGELLQRLKQLIESIE